MTSSFANISPATCSESRESTLRKGINESLIGTSFLRLGELGHDDCIRFRQIRTDVVDNQIDTLGKAFQGLTVACARCHDHKLDPIPTSDYYALYGALTSSRMVMRNADTPDVNAAAKQRLRELKPLIRTELAKQWIQETGPDSAVPDGGTSRLERTSSQAAGSQGSLARPDSGMADLARETKAWNGRAALSVDPVRRHRHRSGLAQAEVTLRRRDAKPRRFQPRELSVLLAIWRETALAAGMPMETLSIDGPSPSGEFAVANSGPARHHWSLSCRHLHARAVGTARMPRCDRLWFPKTRSS